MLPLLGGAADVVGRKPILLLSYVSSALEFGLLAFFGTHLKFIWLTRCVNAMGARAIAIPAA